MDKRYERVKGRDVKTGDIIGWENAADGVSFDVKLTSFHDFPNNRLFFGHDSFLFDIDNDEDYLRLMPGRPVQLFRPQPRR